MSEREILSNILKTAQVNLTEASKLSHIPQPRFSEWLTGKRIPKWGTLLEIAKSLHIEIDMQIVKK